MARLIGRRLEVDFIVRAVEIAKQVASPVKVVWTREEDIQHDMYRPYYYDRIAAGLDARGGLIARTHRDAVEFQDPLYPPHACL